MMWLKLAWSYFKIGIFGFGGGYAMLSLIEREIVGDGWLTPAAFTDIVAVSQMTPGPIGINSATYIGFVAGETANIFGPVWIWGILGALMCTLIVTVPSSILAAMADGYVSRHRDNRLIASMMDGLRPVVPGLIAAAALLLMNGENFGTVPRDIVWSVIICVATLIIVKTTRLHPAILIPIMGLAGYLIF